jgi:hypothetical protein
LTQDVLRNYALQNKIEKQEKYVGHSVFNLSDNKFLKSYTESLLPYINEPEKFSPQLSQLKTNEAIELLLASNNSMKSFYSTLVNLIKLIWENSSIKISCSIFQCPSLPGLTGRSLSTFKRNETPEKWLRNRRLDEAKYLMTEKRLKPIDVYYSVGFENFSHFSDAFKQRFGFNASTVV